MSVAASIQNNQTSQISSTNNTGPLAEFAKECATVYYEMKSIRDQLVTLPYNERKRFQKAVDKVDFAQMTLDRKCNSSKFLKAQPEAKQMIAYLDRGLTDLERMMYPPKIAVKKNVMLKAFIGGAVSGALTGGASSVIGGILNSQTSSSASSSSSSSSLSTHNITPSNQMNTHVTQMATGVNEIVWQGSIGPDGEMVNFDWPGLFPFLLGAGEVVVGLGVAVFAPPVGKAIMWDGFNRMVDGIVENAESGMNK